MNRRDRDEKCALCNEYSIKQADPEQAAIGMGRCLARTDGKISTHVAWDSETCVSYKLDRPNLAARRQYIQVQFLNQQSQKETPP